MDNFEAAAFLFHDRTKHHPERYARSLGYMDWRTQPDPFRRFEGAPLVKLREVEPTDQPTLDAIWTGTDMDPVPVSQTSISQFFYDSLAISAWKEFQDSRWALRCNPSSGNLHPTEGYMACGPIDGVCERPSVFHYAPGQHGLELRSNLRDAAWNALAKGLPAGSFFVGLSSIHWRESWKYGERAYRYCQHDVGHAVAALAYAAAALGWKVRLDTTLSGEELSALFRIDDQTGIEAEHPDCLLVIDPTAGKPTAGLNGWCPERLSQDELFDENARGTPNQLSSEHHPWPVIEEVAEACVRNRIERDALHWLPPVPEVAFEDRGRSARKIFRSRRSAVEMDGWSRLDVRAFETIVRRLSPARGSIPFATLPWRPAVHPIFFVHSVTGLDSGLYILVRDKDDLELLQREMSADFEWRKPEDAPQDLEFYRLAAGDCKGVARHVSCHQEIASDGVFAVSMLARYESAIREHGPWFYRALHWEAGMLGQVLYLEAEAAELRGTGIGCFFDDVMHQVLGLQNREFQDIYHFTVGGPVDDPRLKTLPAYGKATGNGHK